MIIAPKRMYVLNIEKKISHPWPLEKGSNLKSDNSTLMPKYDFCLLLKSGLHVKYDPYIFKINLVMAIFVGHGDEKSQFHKIWKS